MREVDMQELKEKIDRYWETDEINVDLANSLVNSLSAIIHKYEDKIVREK
ncbi:hypothetical protein 0305phi8-36p212 [Bacillus phage 0305phi8-36]|nr:hypothetical protein ST0305phi8-36p212 [Bacillus phage 0305phi8-36]ABS83770.1 hypothetical protein 0305phi8-36p212 [Bacillus phage 0305phi8-36]